MYDEDDIDEYSCFVEGYWEDDHTAADHGVGECDSCHECGFDYV